MLPCSRLSSDSILIDPWLNSRALSASYEFLTHLLNVIAPREVALFPRSDQVALVATDAQADSAPTGGFVIWGKGATRCAFCRFTHFLHELVTHQVARVLLSVKGPWFR